METAAATHPGKTRTGNQDAYLVRRFDQGALLAVADGAGGQAAGERASGAALEILGGFTPGKAVERRLAELILEAHVEINEIAEKDPGLSGMAATLTAVFVSPQEARFAHVGDSRLYLFRGGKLKPVTEDHTVPGMLFRNGEITEEQARKHPLGNVLLKCVGCKQCEPDTGRLELKSGDVILVCSDGLYKEVPEHVIAATLKTGAPLQDLADALIEKALDAGGRDNVTAVLARV